MINFQELVMAAGTGSLVLADKRGNVVVTLAVKQILLGNYQQVKGDPTPPDSIVVGILEDAGEHVFVTRIVGYIKEVE